MSRLNPSDLAAIRAGKLRELEELRSVLSLPTIVHARPLMEHAIESAEQLISAIERELAERAGSFCGLAGRPS